MLFKIFNNFLEKGIGVCLYQFSKYTHKLDKLMFVTNTLELKNKRGSVRIQKLVFSEIIQCVLYRQSFSLIISFYNIIDYKL